MAIYFIRETRNQRKFANEVVNLNGVWAKVERQWDEACVAGNGAPLDVEILSELKWEKSKAPLSKVEYGCGSKEFGRRGSWGIELTPEEQDVLDRSAKKLKSGDLSKPMDGVVNASSNNGVSTEPDSSITVMEDVQMPELEDIPQPEISVNVDKNEKRPHLSYKEKLLGINGRGAGTISDDEPFSDFDDMEEETNRAVKETQHSKPKPTPETIPVENRSQGFKVKPKKVDMTPINNKRQTHIFQSVIPTKKNPKPHLEKAQEHTVVVSQSPGCPAHAEIWGVFFGLLTAWDKGFRKIQIESDNSVIMKIVQFEHGSPHPLRYILLRIKDLVQRDWHVEFKHVFREGNRVADCMAFHAHSMALGLNVFIDPPRFCYDCYRDDLCCLPQ
ncbi:heat shock 70 kDa protein-like [Senna tora]|uniref:Heat shock 70 kDa protein-like n=1 Tax=Senna tora TaxID=362788 RepID=A0A834SPB2_9FABA|nr:heat shock 70 kDa protein-like [Senna tora]